jgi:hypothetical protein
MGTLTLELNNGFQRNTANFKAIIQSWDEIKKARRVGGELCFIVKLQLSDQEVTSEAR